MPVRGQILHCEVSPTKPKTRKAPEGKEGKPGKDPRTSAIQRARGKKESGASAGT